MIRIMKNIYSKLFISVLAISLIACSSEDDLVDDWIEANTEETGDLGSAGGLDLSNYVAVGNSLTAGFSDAALHPIGQANSYPSILAAQFALVGGGAFNYPDISSGNGFGGVDDSGNIIGKSFINIPAALADPSNAIQFTSGSALSANTVASLNNFGIPGARVVDYVTPGYGHSTLGNPFYASFASSEAARPIDDAAAAGGTFFSVWLGNNDVLGYASGGGVDEAEITDVATFTADLSTVLDEMSANGADGVILNVPPIQLAPFFQIVTTLSGGVNILPAGSIDAPTAAFLNSADAYGEYNGGLMAAVALGVITAEEAAFRTITFEGDEANAPVITDESLTVADISLALGLPAGSVILPNMRQAQVDATTGAYDLFPLTALAVVGTEAIPGDPSSVYGVGVPLPDAFTLTMNDEQVQVVTAYATFNAVIAGQAAARPNITLVDVGPVFADAFGLSAPQAAGLQLSTEAQSAADGVLGISIEGFNFVPLDLGDNLFNSIFSSDGVHPNGRGAAIIANEIIDAINSAHSASIPKANVLDYAAINAVL